ncbi:MAG: hypothetical protein ACRDZO_28060 [Egibacteraceae bacterium]
MTKTQRVVLLAIALLTAVIAVVLLGSTRDEPEPRRSAVAAPTASPTASAEREDSSTPTPTPAPSVPTLTAENPRRLKFRQGEIVRFAVRSDQDEEIHVHGYDKSQAVDAGKRAEMSFKAEITGIFEIELERSGTPVGELEVRP